MERFPTLALALIASSACASGRAGGEAEPAPPAAEPPAVAAGSLPPVPVPGCGHPPELVTPRYVLPFARGDSHALLQGNCRRPSHEGRWRYSFDFEMSVGTPVIAARDGIVGAVRDDRPDGTDRVGDENFVILSHEDGESSRYIHLTAGGALVGVGDTVSRGDTIALSGDSGRSSIPHLHFDVVWGCLDGTPCRTVPVAFLNADPPVPSGRREAITARPFPAPSRARLAEPRASP